MRVRRSALRTSTMYASCGQDLQYGTCSNAEILAGIQDGPRNNYMHSERGGVGELASESLFISRLGENRTSAVTRVRPKRVRLIIWVRQSDSENLRARRHLMESSNMSRNGWESDGVK